MKEKREINAGRVLGWSLLVSVLLGLLLGTTSSVVLWYVVTALLWTAGAFFCLFWAIVIVAAIGGMEIKGPENRYNNSGAKDSIENFVAEDIDWEEDVEEKKARRKALRRIKKLQRDYPDMWESLLSPDDEYYCYDYVYEKKQKKEEEESAGFAAVWTAMNANNSGNGNSSS